MEGHFVPQLIEEGMHQHLHCPDAVIGPHPQHLLQEVSQERAACTLQVFSQGHTLYGGQETDELFSLLQLAQFLRADHSADVEQGINSARPAKEFFLGQ